MSATRKTLNYNEIQDTLGLSDHEQVEELVLESIYSKLIEGTIDEQNHCLHISKVFGRDVPPEKVDSLLDTLDEWVKNISKVESSMTEVVKSLNDNVSTS